MYEKIIFAKNKIKRNFPKWPRLHCSVLPNYLKTFNYKASTEILPFKTNFVEFGLDTDSRCNFCNRHADTATHLFCHCITLQPIWRILDQVLQKMNFTFRFTENRKSSNFYLISATIQKDEENLVIYLNSIMNYKIWKFNMKIQYEGDKFCEKKMFKSIIKTIGGRENMEFIERLKQCKKISKIAELNIAIKQVYQNSYVTR